MKLRNLHGEEAAAFTTEWLHPVLMVDDTACCGDSWCDGRCGLPAAVLPVDVSNSEECKLYGSMVACGHVVQRFRVKWIGARFVVPVEHRDDLRKKLWW